MWMSDPCFEKTGDIITCTIEECAELIHILCKVQRFGWKNFNPYDEKKTPNFELVKFELEDLKKRIGQLEEEIRKNSNAA